MKLATIRQGDEERAALGTTRGFVPVSVVAERFGLDLPRDLLGLLQGGGLAGLGAWHRAGGREALEGLPEDAVVPRERLVFGPLYRRPRKIWGIGLNYRAHAADLSERVPEGEPASFMKPDTAIIGPGDTIEVPEASTRTTAEAELGVVIGRVCKDVPRREWLSAVAGFTTVLDMTAEDILSRNPRYLTLSKSFDTFFSFGPTLVTPDEVDDLAALEIATVSNGRVHARNTVSRMTFPPDFLVSFHSRVMTLLPGDVISTGTPGAVPIGDGDRVECRIPGFEVLANPVRDRKRRP